MTVEEASKILKMLLGYLKGEIEPPSPKTIEEAKKFEQDGHKCLNIAIRSLEAWEKVKAQLESKRTAFTFENTYEEGKNVGLVIALDLIDKHLKEVEDDK